MKRICDGCGKDRPSLYQINKGNGHGKGLYGTCCAGWAQAEEYLDSFRRNQIVLTEEEIQHCEEVIEEQKPKAESPAGIISQG